MGHTENPRSLWSKNLQHQNYELIAQGFQFLQSMLALPPSSSPRASWLCPCILGFPFRVPLCSCSGLARFILTYGFTLLFPSGQQYLGLGCLISLCTSPTAPSPSPDSPSGSSSLLHIATKSTVNLTMTKKGQS